MEIGDVYVVNKSDRPGGRSTRAEIDRALATRYMGQPGVNRWEPALDRTAATYLSQGVQALNFRHGDPGSEASTWRPPALETVAISGAGTTELADATEAFLRWATLTSRVARKRQQQIEQHLLRLLTTRLIEAFVTRTQGISSLARQAQRIAAGQASPQEAAEELARLVVRRSA